MALPSFYSLEKKINGFADYGFFDNGGKGSGNFGHSGRPGKRGGSGEGKSASYAAKKEQEAKDVSKVAQKSIEKAAKEEPEVTKDLQEVFDKNGNKFIGLDFRLKGEGSLSRKILTDAYEKGQKKSPKTAKELAKVASKINDNLRYTCELNKDDFGNGYEKVKNDLEAKGYEFVKVKNTMGDTKGGYRGVNTQVKNKNGYIFELQFHTAQSFDTKDKAHVLYEVARDTKKSAAERKAANKEMESMFKAVEMPSDVDKIKSFNKLK